MRIGALASAEKYKIFPLVLGDLESPLCFGQRHQPLGIHVVSHELLNVLVGASFLCVIL